MLRPSSPARKPASRPVLAQSPEQRVTQRVKTAPEPLDDAPCRRRVSGGSRHSDDPRSELPATLDPLLFGVLLAREAPSAAAATATAHTVPAGLQELIARLSRRAAWGGDGARGTARLELGAGPLAGTVLTVHADSRELRVELELPPDMAEAGLAARLRERLTHRGFAIAELRVS
jgi:hypothetical protein